MPVAGGRPPLLLAPTLSGHALDPSQPRILAALADLAHLAAAAVWLGGLLALVYVVPRTTDDEPTRIAAARRFSTVALAAVIVIGATGVARSLTELSAVHQVWSTSYGRTLLAKTVLFVPLIGLGWLNRTLLLGAFARLRRSMLVEVAVILGVVVAVAVLTELRPGREASRGLAAESPQVAQPPVLPPRAAVVDARELGSLGVAVARTPGSATVTLLGPDGTGVSGRSVLVAGARAAPCGAGCYRAPAPAGPLRVTVSGRTLTFSLPARAPDARALLRDVTRRYRAAKTIVFDESLASSPADVQQTRFNVVAPDRLAYAIQGGPAAIVIGARRWDRDRAGAPWLLSQQAPLDVTQPYWRTPTNVHLVAPGVVTFLDRRVPLGSASRSRAGCPIARAHDGGSALHDRPLRRVRRAGHRVAAFAVTLRLFAHQLEKARRVLERRQTGRSLARAAWAGRRTTRRRDRTCRTDQPADRKRAEPAPARGAVHATILPTCG